MRLLVVTEKLDAAVDQRDGGARLIASLQHAFTGRLDVLQFDDNRGKTTGRLRYPAVGGNRFDRRMANADFIAEKVRDVVQGYTHVLFVHVSMQFGFADRPLRGVRTWTLPMFLTPSYEAAGELVPPDYTALERRTLAGTDRILTPSHFERRQLVAEYGVRPDRIRVVPRGVDATLLAPRVRQLSTPLRFCSVGSIKRQKNTLGLIRLFDALRQLHSGATLRLVGPVQDDRYADLVRDEIAARGLGAAVTWQGYVAPHDLADALADAHMHLSASHCETFGRAIFETLASGLPNIAPLQNNAAAEFLGQTPYALFYREEAEACAQVESLLHDYASRSALALEIGELYDDRFLADRLAAEVLEDEAIVVSDFDGTLFHKENADRTTRCAAAFGSYRRRIVCSARPVPDLLAAMARIGISADFIVGWSGAVVADGHGRVLWQLGLSAEHTHHLESNLPDGRRLPCDAPPLQFAIDGAVDPGRLDLRAELYQGITFVADWHSSKLRAVHRLLRHIHWPGRVRAFGDGPYDLELLTYFDGVHLCPPSTASTTLRQGLEVTDDAA